MKWTLFREGGVDSPVSMRRVQSFIAFLSGDLMLACAIPYLTSNWFAILPGTIIIVAAVLLLLFTTWSDLADAASKIKGGR